MASKGKERRKRIIGNVPMQVQTAKNPGANQEFFSTRKDFNLQERDPLSEKTVNKKLKKFESESRLYIYRRSNHIAKRTRTC